MEGSATFRHAARKIALLNQADTAELQAQAADIARAAGDLYDAVLVASTQSNVVHAVHEPCTGIVLAAGAATRFGAPKQLLDWHGAPLVRVVASAALGAGLSPVIVVTGAEADGVEAALHGLKVIIVRNQNWMDGQSTSIRTGLGASPVSTGAAVFLLADQPLITPEVIHALVAAHATEPASIFAPLVGGDRRGNPVLFDREAFADLDGLQGDTGGRAIFSRHSVYYIPWHDEGIARDIDTPADYHDLLQDGAK